MATSVPMGIVSLKAEGAYAADKLYKKGMWVTSSGSSYAYINPTPAAGVALTDASHWQQIAEKGDTFNLKGEWDDEAEDAFFDVVEYYGSSYVYTNPIPSTGNVPTNVAYWQLLAKAGGQFVDTESLTWEGVQDVIIQGLGPTVFPIGTQLQTAHSAYVTIVWNVVAHNYDLDPTGRKTYSMTLHMHRVIYGRQFDALEMLWANTGASPLPAGTYNFTLFKGANGGETGEDGTYQFTTMQPIPVGGGFRHSNVGLYKTPSTLYVPANIIGNHLTTYNASGVAIESNLAVSAGSSGTALGTASRAAADITSLVGTLNGVQRNAYGSNHWGTGAVRQWLNSDAPANAWWTPQTIFDLPPTYADVAGFLNGLDPAFVAVLGETDHITINNTVTDGGSVTPSYVTRDKIYLPSRTEIFGSNEVGGTPEGEQYPFYVGSDDADKIKYDISSPATARNWWMRTPGASGAGIASTVNTSGALGNSSAYGGNGAAAACVIL